MSMIEVWRNRIAEARNRIEGVEAGFITGTIGELVTNAAIRHRHRVAFKFIQDTSEATYDFVDQYSNRLARFLKSKGVSVGTRVAMMMSNRLEYLVSWFAIAKIGAIIVPLNTRYTSREIAYVLEDAACNIAIIEESVRASVLGMTPWPKHLEIGNIFELPVEPGAASFYTSAGDFPPDPLPPAATPDSILNIQYTSGTTGWPKGCMLTHEYWRVFAYQAASWDISGSKNLLTAQPLYYADAQWHVLKAMLIGGTLHIAPRLSATLFPRWLQDFGIEWCQLPELVARTLKPDTELALKDVTAFGWSPEACRRFHSVSSAHTADAFGMTEIAFGLQMPPHFQEMYDSGSVGIPAPFREVRLVRKDGSEAQFDEVGELWIRGRSIFKGYWNRPDANAEAFVDGWFRTGDLLKSDERGFYWMVGRIKDMIRRSSENISAREVEAIIRELPEIEDVAAVPVPDPDRGEEVKIYVKMRSQQPKIAVTKILEHARARLAPFKVPRYISYVDEFPRTATKKIRKQELVRDIEDLRLGSFDAQDDVWR